MTAAIATIKAYSQKADYTIGITVDDDDDVTLNSTHYLELQRDPNIYFTHGKSESKVHAINRGMHAWKGDIVVNMSDDMRFLVPGYDIKIINAFADNLDQFIHFPDGRVNHLLPTMSIMGRTYYERFGYIYHPQYFSLWCDNEAMDVAKKLGKWKYVPERIFDHYHPAWTGEPIDAQLRHTQGYYHIDEQTYIKRSAAGFPNENV
jgi:glycosyltransferase involved in cell wall biosynthesis